MPLPRPVMLIVLDGWGLREERSHNAIAIAKTPVMDSLLATRPNTRLRTCGRSVGLPEGQMGNSEVGHLNLGAGRVVNQDIRRIETAIEDGSFGRNPVLIEAARAARKSGGALHVIGLVSDGGVHSHQDHGVAVARLARREGVERIFAHAFTDGRDTPPQSGRAFVAKFAADLEREAGGRIATVMGRYYAMDRDKRWERTERAYRAMVAGEGIPVADPVAGIQDSYSKGVTDEFIEPRVVQAAAAPLAPIRDGDAVVCFNFRSDRARQITRALAIPGFDGFGVSGRPRIHYTCMTEYDETFGLPVAFPLEIRTGLLCHALEAAGKTCLRTAETEKYPHVTFFFNGGVEEPPKGERRVMVPSPKVPTYDLQPEMSAEGVTQVVLQAIEEGKDDVIIVNYANPDMVGHTGVEAAAVKAVETVDACLGRVLRALEAKGGAAVVTADHGNCEQMWDEENNSPHTAHTLNDTPCIVVVPGFMGPLRAAGSLCDVAPTLLGLMEVPPTSQMTGRDLRLHRTER